MPIGKVSIIIVYHLCICFCVCLFVGIRISLPRIKLAALNFAGRFNGVQGRESPILENFTPQNPKIGRIGQHGLVVM